MEKITHRTVHELHQQSLSAGDDLSQNTMEIVNAIGGIDQVLMDYLTQPQLISSINNTQLQKIHEIISNATQNRFQEKKQRAQNNIIRQTDADIEGIAKVLILNTNDTWLYTIFNTNIDDKLYLFVWHKITIIFMHIIAALAFVLYSVFPTNKVIICLDIIATILWTPYMFLIVLSANTVASKSIFKSFEFYLKMYYIVVYFVSAVTFWIMDLLIKQEHDAIHQRLMIVAWSTSIPFFLLLQAFIFSLDAYNINWKIKILLPSITSINFFILWTQLTFFLYTTNDKQDVSVVKVTNNIHISLYSQQQGASFIIFIFCLKQSFMTWYRQREKFKNKKAVLMRIKEVPRIKWQVFKSTDNIATSTDEMDTTQETVMRITKYQIKTIKSKYNSFSISMPRKTKLADHDSIPNGLEKSKDKKTSKKTKESDKLETEIEIESIAFHD